MNNIGQDQLKDELGNYGLGALETLQQKYPIDEHTKFKRLRDGYESICFPIAVRTLPGHEVASAIANLLGVHNPYQKLEKKVAPFEHGYQNGQLTLWVVYADGPNELYWWVALHHQIEDSDDQKTQQDNR